MSDKKNRPLINMDYTNLYPHVMKNPETNFTPKGFRRIFRMISIKKIFKIFEY